MLQWPVCAQTPTPEKLDSLRTVLFSTDRQNLPKILEIGEYIAVNAPSPKQKFEAYSRISESYFTQNDIDKSVTYLFKGKKVAEDSQDAGLMAQAYGSIANQYAYLNLTQKARNYLGLAKEQIDRLPENSYKHKLKALSFLELGNLDFNDSSYIKANENYRKSLYEFNRISIKKDVSVYHYRRSLYNIGNSYYYLNRIDSAEIYLNKALIVKDPENQSLNFYIKATLAEVYARKKEYQRAIDTLQAIIRDSAFDINSLKTEIYLNLALNYKKTGDDANYSLYNEKHLAMKNAVDSQDLKAINTAFDVEQHDLRSRIRDSDEKFRWLATALAAIIVISGFVLVYLYRKRKNETEIYRTLIEKLKNQVESISDENTESIPEEEEPRQQISAAVEQSILSGLDDFENAEEFRNPDVTLPTLATRLKTNPAYVSAVIKANKGMNFNGYINELRIRYICDKLYRNPEYLNYKISYLAEDSGFVSHSAFSTIFKKVSGISPSSFIRQARKAHASQTNSASAA